MNQQITIVPNEDERPETRRDTLWVTDAEMIRRLGVPEKIAYRVIEGLDAMRGGGFPQKNKLWGNRRYWPAVKAYFDRQSGLIVDASQHRRASGDR